MERPRVKLLLSRLRRDETEVSVRISVYPLLQTFAGNFDVRTAALDGSR